MIKEEVFKLYNGIVIPKVGFGTWQIADGDDALFSVSFALKNGYRHIDTAHAYGNEKSVGKAIKNSNLKREEIFITTKLPSHIKTYDGTLEYFNESLNNLNVDYIDLYLIHAPWPWSNIGQDCTNGNIEAWKAMIKLYNDGKIKAIGVSNFHIKDIEALVEATGVKPMVNQIRYFIGNTQKALTKYCQDNDILVEAYSPLATGNILNDENILKLSQKYQKTPAQICIRYCLENNTLPLPKSVNEERILANIDLDFEISREDMDYLDSLENKELQRKLRS